MEQNVGMGVVLSTLADLLDSSRDTEEVFNQGGSTAASEKYPH